MSGSGSEIAAANGSALGAASGPGSRPEGAEEPAAPPAARLLALDRLFLAYMAITGILAPAAGGRAGVGLALLHGLAIAGLLAWSGRPLPRGRAARVVRLSYPVILTPLLYLELPLLNQLLVEGYLDPLVQGWEVALFGGQPSLGAAGRLPSFWLSELLHLGYLCYYLLVPGALLGVWATRGDVALHRAAFSTALAFFACYLVFVVFPVAGPRYLFPAIDGPAADGALSRTVHTILEGASSKGAAFPSSHVAGSGAAVLAAGLFDRRWFWLLLPAWFALALGTVFGRFHYGVDAAVGALVALAAGWLGPGLAARLGCVASLEVGGSVAPPGPGGSPASQGAGGSVRSNSVRGSTGTPPT